MNTVITLYLLAGFLLAVVMLLQILPLHQKGKIKFRGKPVYGLRAAAVVAVLLIVYVGLLWPVFLVKDVLLAE